MAGIGMAMILVSIALIWLERIGLTTLPLVVSALFQAVGVFLFRREESAYKRVSLYSVQLNELNQLGNILAICDSLLSPQDKEECKKKVIDKVLNKWFGLGGQ